MSNPSIILENPLALSIVERQIVPQQLTLTQKTKQAQKAFDTSANSHLNGFSKFACYSTYFISVGAFAVCAALPFAIPIIACGAVGGLFLVKSMRSDDRNYEALQKQLEDCYAERRERLRNAAIAAVIDAVKLAPLQSGQIMTLTLEDETPKRLMIGELWSSPVVGKAYRRLYFFETVDEDGIAITGDKAVPWMTDTELTEHDLNGASLSGGQLSLPAPAPIDEKRQKQIITSLVQNLSAVYLQGLLDIDYKLHFTPEGEVPLIATVIDIHKKRDETGENLIISINMKLHEAASPDNACTDEGKVFLAIPAIKAHWTMPDRPKTVTPLPSSFLHQGNSQP